MCAAAAPGGHGGGPVRPGGGTYPVRPGASIRRPEPVPKPMPRRRPRLVPGQVGPSPGAIIAVAIGGCALIFLVLLGLALEGYTPDAAPPPQPDAPAGSAGGPGPPGGSTGSDGWGE